MLDIFIEAIKEKKLLEVTFYSYYEWLLSTREKFGLELEAKENRKKLLATC